MDLGLTGKTAIVTGGATGIGRAAAEMLAAEGCFVAICDIAPGNTTEECAVSITEMTGTKCIAVHADVSREDDVAEMNRAVIEEYGSYDILVNNASVSSTAYAADLELADWEKVIGVNLTGAFLTSKAAIRHFIEKETKGRIINLTSQSAFRGTTSGHTHYTASKAGLVGMTRTLALETAGYGICVNAVAPGIVNTAVMAEKICQRGDLYKEKIPIGRVAEPEDVAYAILFLASVMGGYITGATLDVSGGMMLR